MKRRKHAKKTSHKKRSRRKHKKAAAAQSHAPKSHRVNEERYFKNKVLLFKLKKQIRTETTDDNRELKNLVRLVRRARRFAA